MGITHGIARLLGGQTGDEEDGGGIRQSNHQPYQILHDQWKVSHSTRPHTNPHSTLSTMSSYLRDFIYKSFESLRQKLLGSIFYLGFPRRRGSQPTLPGQNPSTTPTSTIIKYSLCDTSANEEIISSASVVDISNVPYLEENEQFKLMLSSTSSLWEATEREKEKEEEVILKSTVVVNDAKWIKHYSSRHWILLVGEGDFSFSTCLALAFDSASNMVATSLDSKAFLKKHYGSAMSNIKELRRRGCKVMHGIDATKMVNHEFLGRLTFDRIIFNFPFAGFFKDLSRNAQLRRHRRLVSLFLKNAKEMVSENGEIHITHKTNGFHAEWKLEVVAASHRLRLIEAVSFDCGDYRGYKTKRGFGGDDNFNCNPSKTYKFALRY